MNTASATEFQYNTTSEQGTMVTIWNASPASVESLQQSTTAVHYAIWTAMNTVVIAYKNMPYWIRYKYIFIHTR